MKIILALLMSLILMGGVFLINGAHAIEANPYGMPETKVIPIKVTVNDRQYELIVKLPQGYEQKIAANNLISNNLI